MPKDVDIVMKAATELSTQLRRVENISKGHHVDDERAIEEDTPPPSPNVEAETDVVLLQKYGEAS